MCWSCFLVTASLTESSYVFVIHLTNVFDMLFPCDSNLFIKTTSVTGQQLALWLLTDLLWSLFLGADITPFWWVLLFQNSAVVPKVAQCVVPMQIRYISYKLFHPPYEDWTIAHGHLRTNHSHSFFTPVRNARNQNTSKKQAHCYTQNTINSKHPSQNSQ